MAKVSMPNMAKVSMPNVELEQAYRKERKRIQQFIRRAKKRGFVFEENILPDKPKKITRSSVTRLQKITPSVLYQKSTVVTPQGEVVKGTKARQQERFVSARKGAQTRMHNISAQKLHVPRTSMHPQSGKREAKQARDKGTYESAKREAKQARDRFYEGKDNKGTYEPSSYDTDESPWEETGLPPRQSYAAIENVREEIRRWTPQPNWSKSLSDLKSRDKSILENLLNGAIASQGEEAVARRLEENSVEINALLQEILYGSGSKEGNFKDGRTQVNFDLARFSAIIMGRSLTVEESMDLTDLAENLEVNN